MDSVFSVFISVNMVSSDTKAETRRIGSIFLSSLSLIAIQTQVGKMVWVVEPTLI